MIPLLIAGRIGQEQSMFAIHRPPDRKRRQVSGPSLDFIFPDPPQPFSVDNLNYTDEQREFCNNLPECMFDLLFTEDTEIAGNTMEANMEATRQEIELSKKVVVDIVDQESDIYMYVGYVIVNTLH